MDGWETTFLLGGLVSGAMLVSGRVYFSSYRLFERFLVNRRTKDHHLAELAGVFSHSSEKHATVQQLRKSFPLFRAAYYLLNKNQTHLKHLSLWIVKVAWTKIFPSNRKKGCKQGLLYHQPKQCINYEGNPSKLP